MTYELCVNHYKRVVVCYYPVIQFLSGNRWQVVYVHLPSLISGIIWHWFYECNNSR